MVNPSSLTKGPNGGTFARFAVHPTSQKELDGEVSKAASGANGDYAGVVDHKVWERARVELVKI